MHESSFLLTGFNAFGGNAVNSSEMTVRSIAAEGARPWLITEILRTEFTAAGEAISRLLAAHRPSVCLCLGLNERVQAITIERWAHNMSHSETGDNAGFRPSRRKIVPEGPAKYAATLRIQKIAAVLEGRDIPFRFSDSAGSFVCNHVFYTVASEVERLALPTRLGFIHVPPIAEPEGSARGMSLKQLVAAIELCMDASREGIRAI